MVAKIESGKNLTGAFHYNENKVIAGKAYMLGTNGYTKSDHLLSFNDKLFRLTDLAARNIRTKTNTIHLSLNFAVNESLEDGKLIDIADEYMKRIGFGCQPYLIYKHLDAGHPHVHIVSTNIQTDGSRISLNNIGKLKSEPARKAIESEFGLVRASDKQKIDQVDEVGINPLVYGTSDTKRAITNIVSAVIRSYKYTSLPELNAVLNLYNVTAYRGTKESVMYKNNGLNYWVIDTQGKRIGVPIKASSMYTKPTLKLLEDRFRLNEYLRKPFKEQLKAIIDRSKGQSISLEQFKKQLHKNSTNVVVRQNSDGRIYGVSYIDNLNKVVFNGSDLGKAYSAAAIINAFESQTPGNKTEMRTKGIDHTKPLTDNFMETPYPGRTVLDDLLNPLAGFVESHQFGPKKRKKKRKNINL